MRHLRRVVRLPSKKNVDWLTLDLFALPRDHRGQRLPWPTARNLRRSRSVLRGLSNHEFRRRPRYRGSSVTGVTRSLPSGLGSQRADDDLACVNGSTHTPGRSEQSLTQRIAARFPSRSKPAGKVSATVADTFLVACPPTGKLKLVA